MTTDAQNQHPDNAVMDWLTEPDESKIDQRLRAAADTDPGLQTRIARRAYRPRWAALERWMEHTTPQQRTDAIRQAWQDHPELADDLGEDGWQKVAHEVERGSFRRILNKGAINGIASRRQVRFVLWFVIPMLVVGVVFQTYDNVLAIHLSRWVCAIAGVVGMVYIGPALYAEARAEVVGRAVTVVAGPNEEASP